MASCKVNLKLCIVSELGFSLDPNSVLMDLGCGAGKAVSDLRGLGYRAYGCDFRITDKARAAIGAADEHEPVLRTIEAAPYHLPFDNDSIDCIISDQVFEHVQDFPETLAEITRVLKPGGFCLHIFPSRYRAIEAHIRVPYSSIFQSYGWLYAWAALGLRNAPQRALTARDVATRNYDFLKAKTNYLRKSQLRKHFLDFFDEVKFCEKAFLKCSRRGHWIYRLSALLPFLPAAYSTLMSRVVLTRLPKKRRGAINQNSPASV